MLEPLERQNKGHLNLMLIHHITLNLSGQAENGDELFPLLVKSERLYGFSGRIEPEFITGIEVRMKRDITVSLAMLPYLPPDAPNRLARTRVSLGELIDQAAPTGADLVAFPEMCTTDGSANLWQFEALDGPTLTMAAAKARQQNIYVVCPLLTLEDGKRYNSSVLIGKDGSLVGHYHKVFPTHWELDQGILPGTETPVFETDLGRVGLSICFDINYWEVGSGLGANQPELVIWSSTWEGSRQLIRWPIEFGFNMGAVCTSHATVVDLAGRQVASLARSTLERVGSASLLNARLNLDLRLLHHDFNLDRLPALFKKYGQTAAYVEHLSDECLLIFGSQLPGKSTDDLIAEFGLEPMHDYLARVRRDRQAVLDGRYTPDLKAHPPLPGTPK
jgi:predicted amidohydrolase